MTTKTNLIKKINNHRRWLKDQQLHASNAYELIYNKIIDQILLILKSKKLVKSDDIPDMPAPPTIKVNVMESISGVMDKYLEALRYMLLGGAISPEALAVVELMRLKSKLPNGVVIQSYLDSTDTHRGIFKDVHGYAPEYQDKFRQKAIEVIKNRCGRHVDQSITELRNRVMNKLELGLQEAIDEQARAAKEAALEKLRSEELNAAQRRVAIKEAISEAVKERMSLHEARSLLRDSFQDYTTNWDRIIHTETQMASGVAAAQTIQETAGKVVDDPIVTLIDKEDDRESEECLTWSHNKDGSWKYYKLSSLKPAGYNLGRKKKDWENSINPRHINCRCSLAYIPSGFKLDENGSLVKLKDGETITIE